MSPGESARSTTSPESISANYPGFRAVHPDLSANEGSRSAGVASHVASMWRLSKRKSALEGLQDLRVSDRLGMCYYSPESFLRMCLELCLFEAPSLG